MDAADDGGVHPLGFSIWGLDPTPAGHEGAMRKVPKHFYPLIRSVCVPLRTPLFRYAGAADNARIANAEEALGHFEFDAGKPIRADVHAVYTLAVFHEHADSSLAKKPWLKPGHAREVKRMRRKNIDDRIKITFGPDFELPPWTGPVTSVNGALPLESFLATGVRSKTNCVVRQCGTAAGESGLCHKHLEWSLRVPIDCSAVFSVIPALADSDWVNMLLGMPGVYYNQNLDSAVSIQRGKYLIGGHFCDDIYAILAGKRPAYGKRCTNLANAAFAGQYDRGVLVRVADVQAFFTYLRGLDPSALDTMVKGLTDWGMAPCQSHGRRFVGLAINRFLEAGADQHVARLVLVKTDRAEYVVSGIVAHCVKVLLRPSSHFTYRVCASRELPADAAAATYTIDACCPEIDFDIRRLGPAESVNVVHAEVMTWGLLYRLVQARCGVTFCGSLTAAFGPTVFGLTRTRVGFVWHVVVQAARDAATNGVFDEALPLQETDASLHETIAPEAKGALSADVPDVVDETYYMLASESFGFPTTGAQKSTTVQAEKVVFGGLSLTEALRTFTRRLAALRHVVDSIH
jgi:hypothetical protein